MRRSIGGYLRGLLAWLALVPAVAWTSPALASLNPPSGPPRSLVAVEGGSSESSRVIWDAGTSTERVIPTNIGGTLFMVPADAAEGSHPVALEDDSGRSDPRDFMVTGERLRVDSPRIDHIMILDAQFDGGDVSATLYVQGANFDVGAVVKIDGTEVATVAHKAITNNLYGVPQEEFAYPIHHFLSVIAVPGAKPAGTEISVVVTNTDNVESTPVTFKLPGSQATLDSDRDSLPDAWESTGYDGDGDGVSDADPHRLDIFVELDIMDGLLYAIEPTGATLGALDTVRAMFAAAPFLNPYTDNGIHLMLDASGMVPAKDTVIFDRAGATGNPADGTTTVAFSALKAEFFGHAALGDVYHYVIWAKRQLGGGSGQSDSPWPVADLQPGDDAIISLDDLAATYQSPRSQAEILAHELGHNLGQKHGGHNDEPYNPNYASVMSYAWALRTGGTDVQRRLWGTCLPFYYAQAGANEPRNTVPHPVNMVVDYSSGMAKQIVETVLDEMKGVCNQAVDWDEDDSISTSTITADANENDSTSETIDDFANWPALRFDGPSLNGTIP